MGTETGVTNDKQTKWASWIMIASLLPYLVAQTPRLLGLNTEGHAFIAVAAAIAVLGLCGYITYQVRQHLQEIFRNSRFSFHNFVLLIAVLLGPCSLRLLGFSKGGSYTHSTDTGETMLFTRHPALLNSGAVFSNPMVNQMRRC